MAFQIYDKPNNTASLAQALGTGLGEGIGALAQHKLDKMLGKKKESELSQLLKGANYDENTANLLAKLQGLDPQNFHKVLSMASGGQGGEGQQTPFAQNARQQQIEKWLQTPHAAKLIDEGNSYDELIDTASRMLSQIDKGISTGVIANAKGKFAPSWLDENSESFLKDAAQLLNISTEKMKGVPSRLRIQWQEAQKPGLNHSPEINRQRLEEIIKTAQSKKNQFFKIHPYLQEFALDRLQPQTRQELESPRQQMQGMQQPQQQMNPIQQILQQDPNASVERDPSTGDLYYNGQLIAKAKRG